jgi:hypothetical protein
MWCNDRKITIPKFTSVRTLIKRWHFISNLLRGQANPRYGVGDYRMDRREKRVKLAKNPDYTQVA